MKKSVRKDLEKLAKETRAEFRKKKITKKTLEEAIKWARSQK